MLHTRLEQQQHECQPVTVRISILERKSRSEWQDEWMFFEIYPQAAKHLSLISLEPCP